MNFDHALPFVCSRHVDALTIPAPAKAPRSVVGTH